MNDEQPKPEQAVTALAHEDGWVIGLATENEAGYNRLNYGPFEAEARAFADATNERTFHVSPKRAMMIVASSMFPAPPRAHAKRRKEWPA